MLLRGPAGGETGDDPQTHLTVLHPLCIVVCRRVLLQGPAGGGTGDDPQTHLTVLHPLVLLFVDVCSSEDLPEVDLVMILRLTSQCYTRLYCCFLDVYYSEDLPEVVMIHRLTSQGYTACITVCRCVLLPRTCWR